MSPTCHEVCFTREVTHLVETVLGLDLSPEHGFEVPSFLAVPGSGTQLWSADGKGPPTLRHCAAKWGVRLDVCSSLLT